MIDITDKLYLQALNQRAEFTLKDLRTGLIRLYFQEVRDLLRETAKQPEDVVVWVNSKGECDVVLENGRPKRRREKESDL